MEAACPKDFQLPSPKNPVFCIDLEEYLHSNPNAEKIKDRYTRADTHAINTSYTKYHSFRELIWLLVYSKEFTEEEKARVIFRWITSHDMSVIGFHQCPRNSPEEAFQTFRLVVPVCYARLYQLLASYSGLYCITIGGYSKGAKCLPGDKFKYTPVNHFWNAVKVNDYWQLVDSQWGGRYHQQLIGEDHEVDVIAEFDDFYFFMDPYRGVYSHLPIISKYQLIQKLLRMTVAQFEKLPLIKSQFFASGMGLDRAEFGVMTAENGALKFCLTYTVLSEFNYKLEILHNGTLEETLNGNSLRRFAILDTEIRKITMHLRLPMAGEYIVTIFSKVVNAFSDMLKNVYRAVAVYRVICEESFVHKRPYIGLVETNFGAHWPSMFYYGLYPIGHPGGFIEVAMDKKPTFYKVVFSRGRPDVTLVAKLRNPFKSSSHEVNLDQSIVTESSQYDDSLITEIVEADRVLFVICLPEEGEYVLEVYANIPKDGASFTHVAQYYVTAHPNLGKKISFTKGFSSIYDATKFEMGSLPNPYMLSEPSPSAIVQESINGTTSIVKEILPCNEKDEADDAEKVSIVNDVSKAKHGSSGSVRKSLSAPPGFQPIIARNWQDTPVELGHLHQESGSLRVNPPLDLDDDTFNVTKRQQKTFNDLIWQLIYSRELSTDSDKIRAIFLWLCTKNLNDIDFPNAEPDSPEEILMQIKKGETSYADVFEVLCRHANIPCRIITGYAKGIAFVPGMKLANGKAALHSWNAAHVDERWYLFDCHWASRRLLGKEAVNVNEIMYLLDEFYYMPDPNLLKRTHYPFESTWQLTAAPVTLEEFEEMTPVKSTFFKYDLALLSHPNGLIECEGELIITIQVPEIHQHQISFTSTIRKVDEISFDAEKNHLHPGEELQRYCILEMTDDVLSFTCRFPASGLYCILLYLREKDSDVFNAVCEYRANAKLSSDQPPLPFPSTKQNVYGRTEAAYQLGLRCDREESAVISSIQCSADFLFHWDANDTKIPNLIGRLRGGQVNEKMSSRLILQRIVTGPIGHLVMTAFLPAQGEFALEVYVKDTMFQLSPRYSLAWQFLLRCTKPHTLGVPPILPGNLLGPLQLFEELGLTVENHPDPLVRVKTVGKNDNGALSENYQQHPRDEILHIALSSPGVRVIADLIYVNDKEEEVNESQYLLQQTSETHVACLLRFPGPGMYKLHLYAQKLDDKEGLVPLVCTYLFQCPEGQIYQGKIRGAFPVQSIKWKEGGMLMEPIDGQICLREGQATQMKFVVQVPLAKDVVIVYGESVFHLNQINGCTWEGLATLAYQPTVKKVTLAARWTPQMSNYPTLLDFEIIKE